jgi:hypothetical protein
VHPCIYHIIPKYSIMYAYIFPHCLYKPLVCLFSSTQLGSFGFNFMALLLSIILDPFEERQSFKQICVHWYLLQPYDSTCFLFIHIRYPFTLLVNYAFSVLIQLFILHFFYMTIIEYRPFVASCSHSLLSFTSHLLHYSHTPFHCVTIFELKEQ